ncbi:MAG: hypothetical protein ACI94Y_001944 [Maribacter sp.]|jgi:hypothetical protein
MQIKSFLIVFLIATFLYSCNISSKYDIDKSIVHSPELDSLTLDSSNFSYPWYMVKHSSGFENTLGEEITAQDTMHFIHNSNTWISGDFGKYKLPFCKIILRNNALFIKILKEDASGHEAIHIQIIDREYNISYYVKHMMPCRSINDYGVNDVYLNKTDFVKGDTLKGMFNIKLKEDVICDQGERNRQIQKTIKGKFIAVIE